MPKVDRLAAAVLDTHVWVWMAVGDARAEALRSFRGIPLVSAISVWEVAMLVEKGRLELRPDVETWIQRNLEPPMCLEAVSSEVAVESCRLTGFHGDPADRIIVATARVCGVPLITADERILRWNECHRRVTVIAV